MSNVTKISTMTDGAARVSACAGTRVRAGFTLTEIMLALGALALISVGVSQVFSLTGRTVAAGRRVSAVTQAAATMERTVRRDLSQITRDGFLIVRNTVTTGNPGATGFGSVGVLPPQAVAQFAGDQAPRPRRADELLFFARGNFVSKREALVDGVVASSTHAMIYYGHGQGQTRNVDVNTAAPLGSGFRTPARLNDQNSSFPIGDVVVAQMLGAPDPLSPNRYASDWTLVRREFLLATPSTQVRPGIDAINRQGTVSSVSPVFTQDSQFQIAMQPAAFSRYSVSADPFGFTPTLHATAPVLSSGLVDIINADVTQMRKSIIQANAWFERDIDVPSSFDLPFGDAFGFNSALQYAGLMNFEMQSMMPAVSELGSRIRVERATPDYFGWGRDSAQPRNDDLERANQLMLASGAFLPRCSEFIVEWSYGLENNDRPQKRTALGVQPFLARPFPRAPRGTIWHGLPRAFLVNPADAGQDVASVDTLSLTLPYAYTQFRSDPNNALARYGVQTEVPLRTGGPRPVGHETPWQVIEQFLVLPNQDPTQYTATFGYIDPSYAPTYGQRRTSSYSVTIDGVQRTFGPQGAFNRLDPSTFLSPDDVRFNNPLIVNVQTGNQPENPVTYDPDRGDIRAWELVRDVNGDGLYNPAEGDKRQFNEPDTLAVAWPRMLRITYTIADATDPSIEQTFQIIVEVPERDGARPDAAF
jgi:type II secretory pathway pseudopilin PulG